MTGLLRNGYPESPMLGSWKIGQGSEYAINEYIKRLKESPKGKITKLSIKEIIKKSKTAYMVRSKQAAGIGTIVHDYAYADENNRPFDQSIIDSHPEKDTINKALDEYKKWKKGNTDTIISAEDIVASTKYWFAGKFDRLAIREGKTVLSDFKTSSGIYIDMFIQLASYKIAIEEWQGRKIDAIEILRFGKDGVFEPKYVDNKDEIQAYTEQAIRVIKTAQFRKEYDK